MQRLKSFDQYKSLNSQESKAKTDDLMPQPVKKEAAPVFDRYKDLLVADIFTPKNVAI